jgi:Replication-relaxation
MPAASHSHLHLTPRDLSILEMVYVFHGCGIEHLHDRLWPCGTSRSATYRRVARLVAQCYLRTYRLASLSGQGSGKAFYMLAGRGRQVLADQQEIPLAHLPRLKPADSSLFVLHHFAICDFRVALELASASFADRLLLSWIGEWELKRTPMRVQDNAPQAGRDTDSRPITLIPDGAFSLTYHNRTQHAFLEMDMGTVSPKRLRTKLRGYLLQQSTVHVPIFFVTHTELREALILRLTLQEAKQIGADPTRIFVTTRNQINKNTILTQPIWQQPGVQTPVSMLPPDSAPPQSTERRGIPPSDGSSPLLSTSRS